MCVSVLVGSSIAMVPQIFSLWAMKMVILDAITLREIPMSVWSTMAHVEEVLFVKITMMTSLNANSGLSRYMKIPT